MIDSTLPPASIVALDENWQRTPQPPWSLEDWRRVMDNSAASVTFGASWERVLEAEASRWRSENEPPPPRVKRSWADFEGPTSNLTNTFIQHVLETRLGKLAASPAVVPALNEVFAANGHLVTTKGKPLGELFIDGKIWWVLAPVAAALRALCARGDIAPEAVRDTGALLLAWLEAMAADLRGPEAGGVANSHYRHLVKSVSEPAWRTDPRKSHIPPDAEVPADFVERGVAIAQARVEVLRGEIQALIAPLADVG